MKRLVQLELGLLVAALGVWLLFRTCVVTCVEGPYVQNPTTNSVVLKWRTLHPTETVLSYGMTPDSCQTRVAVNSPLNSSNPDPRRATPGQQRTHHEVTISGLTAGTTYYYRLEAPFRLISGDGRASTRYFQTLPKPGSDRAGRVWVLGDSGTGDQRARAVRNSYLRFAATRRADVCLMLGDNAYPAGSRLDYDRGVFVPYTTIVRNTPVYPALGNHDLIDAQDTGRPIACTDIFVLPQSGESGGEPSHTERYYSFDYGYSRFICLDSNVDGPVEQEAMLEWLKRNLQASREKRWLIAYWHHPPYSYGHHDSDVEPEGRFMRQRVLPLLDEYGVDIVLCGHSHNYGRSFLVNGYYGEANNFDTHFRKCAKDETVRPLYEKPPIRSAGQGTVYVVLGSSGKVDTNTLTHPVYSFRLNVLGSGILDCRNDTLEFKFIDATAQIRDEFTIRKGFPAPSPQPSVVGAR